ncbi:phosphodiester glycosidase family protein [Sanguibacter sp. Leaf3]|uniref:phosphodiester glycosidase family protein n=1 Tax=Sanguibacter sp. Leaf3 TaxID=1736209 RepID=UPI000702398C|nr:phosphodiester glycosidase family protein [Sanguibacter sp. Leaf3]KQT99681.1 exopolysaccharide biosynthesis protein [Sanguibacter sp. Leaf3]
MNQPTRTPEAPRRPRRVRRAVLAGVLAVALPVAGGTAWALDRYVVEHVEISDVSAYEASQAAAAGTAATTADTAESDTSGVLTDTTYTSDDADISVSTVTTGTGDDTVTYYVADVTLTDATVLRSAFAQDAFGENITETTSDIAADNDAVFAINGDYYGFRDTGIVIRNGVVYRDEGARQGLAFYTDGHVEVYDETATTADQLVADGVWNTLSFGPALLEDGQVLSGIDDVEVDTNFGNHSIQGEQPRTAVGVVDDNHLVFVVVDGRSPGYSAGVTMTGLAEIMQGLGATTAYNLDGGGSSTMVFGGELVNDPLGKDQERGTSDILYIGG